VFSPLDSNWNSCVSPLDLNWKRCLFPVRFEWYYVAFLLMLPPPFFAHGLRFFGSLPSLAGPTVGGVLFLDEAYDLDPANNPEGAAIMVRAFVCGSGGTFLLEAAVGWQDCAGSAWLRHWSSTGNISVLLVQAHVVYHSYPTPALHCRQS
jgi:hypothetical protein